MSTIFSSLDLIKPFDFNELITSVNVVAELLATGEDFNFIEAIQAIRVVVMDVTQNELLFILSSIKSNERRKLKAIDTLGFKSYFFTGCSTYSYQAFIKD